MTMSTKSLDSAPQLVIRDLVKRYHFQPVLNQLSLTLTDGDFCILVGANGAGKTTLLRILATLVRPNQGEILLGGRSLTQSPALRREIGYIGHQPMFYNDLTALENLHHYARLYAYPHPAELVRDAVQSVGLTPHQHKPVRTFSRGMQHRLSIARALLHHPHYLFFDEPYTGLDTEAAQILDAQLQYLHQPGRIILLAAHQPGRLLRMASHIAWLQDGKISHHIPAASIPEVPALQAYLQEGA